MTGAAAAVSAREENGRGSIIHTRNGGSVGGTAAGGGGNSSTMSSGPVIDDAVPRLQKTIFFRVRTRMSAQGVRVLYFPPRVRRRVVLTIFETSLPFNGFFLFWFWIPSEKKYAFCWTFPSDGQTQKYRCLGEGRYGQI